MSVDEKDINDYGEKAVIVMTGDNTLIDAFDKLQQKGYPENDSYLVVALPAEEYHVDHFTKLQPIRVEKGSERLSHLPIPPASRVILQNTTETGAEIYEWVATNPGSRVIIVDEHQNFVALFANENMGGFIGVPPPVK